METFVLIILVIFLFILFLGFKSRSKNKSTNTLSRPHLIKEDKRNNFVNDTINDFINA